MRARLQKPIVPSTFPSHVCSQPNFSWAAIRERNPARPSQRPTSFSGLSSLGSEVHTAKKLRSPSKVNRNCSLLLSTAGCRVQNGAISLRDLRKQMFNAPSFSSFESTLFFSFSGKSRWRKFQTKGTYGGMR